MEDCAHITRTYQDAHIGIMTAFTRIRSGVGCLNLGIIEAMGGHRVLHSAWSSAVS